ncbi:MAG: PIN domain-containing protein [Bifidobacteriaceae bacterium]|jgi:toxin-antitoxin system PIN domain toxin|nr:PIN domain-containing protein [Bifidobacteriaceae bacterium]
MTIHLLDANVLIALSYQGHEHHSLAEAWLEGAGRIATCPITEGALVRFLVRMGHSGKTAQAALQALAARAGTEFWPDSVRHAEADLSRVIGHRQVTDAYLVSLARSHDGHDGAVLATLDRGLVATYPADTRLIALPDSSEEPQSEDAGE